MGVSCFVAPTCYLCSSQSSILKIKIMRHGTRDLSHFFQETFHLVCVRSWRRCNACWSLNDEPEQSVIPSRWWLMVAGGPSGHQLVTNDRRRQENIRVVLMSNPLCLLGLLIASLEIWYHFSTSLTWVHNTNDEMKVSTVRSQTQFVPLAAFIFDEHATIDVNARFV